MYKKLLAISIIALILNFFCVSSATAQSKELTVDEAKAAVAKLGTGPKAMVRVTLKDKKRVQGWLSSAGEDHFTVTNEKSGTLTDINYSEMTEVKSLKPSKSLIAVGAVAVVGTAVLIFLFAGAKH
jgi:hypothetical protein